MAEQGEAIERLAKSLEGSSAVLMVGAGSSQLSGYPSWPALIARLKEALAPDLDFQTVSDLTEQADMIKAFALESRELDTYHRFLEQEFGPREHEVPIHSMHLTLVQLGFAGIVTTNFDRVIETAVEESRRTAPGQISCRSLDLCAERPYPVFEFMRSLRRVGDIRDVLHLHGFYDSPQRLILTATDYQSRYGNTTVNLSEGGHATVPLDTIHRKVLWALFVTYELLFVGFSITDPAFRMLLEVVQSDFSLGAEQVHLALMPRRGDIDEGDVRSRLRDTGVEPIFYDVLTTNGGNEDHSGLQTLVTDLSERLGRPAPQTELQSLGQRLLEL